MSRWKVVSFFTEGTGYEQEILKLESSLIRFGIDYRFFICRPTGTWRGNLNYKSEIIMEAFDLYPDKDIVFLDADAVVRKYPALFDELSEKRDHDAAAHYFQWYSFARNELLSGTLWFQNSEAGRLLAKRWHEIGLAHPEKRHQECLKAAIAEAETLGPAYPVLGRPFNIFHLPLEYTCIFDAPARRGKEAVIEHFQASRRFRKAVGYGGNLIYPGKPPGWRPNKNRVLHAGAR